MRARGYVYVCVSVRVFFRARARVQRACVLTSVRVLACARLHTLDCYLSFICSCVRACVHACARCRTQPRLCASFRGFGSGSGSPPFPFGLWVRRRRLPKMRMNASRSSYRGFPPPEQCELAWNFRGRPDELDEVVEAAVPEAAARSARSCTHAHSLGGGACRGNLNGKRARHSPESPCPCGLRC